DDGGDRLFVLYEQNAHATEPCQVGRSAAIRTAEECWGPLISEPALLYYGRQPAGSVTTS
ncbi:MAG: hypothetical protein K0Q72_3377, partial [Armatimonadetes bacterium]|nr:hypothetical protein [Armatimonadota bacterium]